MNKIEIDKEYLYGLIQSNAALTRQVAEQSKLIAEQSKQIEILNQRIEELTAQLNKNSHNSSMPPSSDGYSKPAPKRNHPGRSREGSVDTMEVLCV